MPYFSRGGGEGSDRTATNSHSQAQEDGQPAGSRGGGGGSVLASALGLMVPKREEVPELAQIVGPSDHTWVSATLRLDVPGGGGAVECDAPSAPGVELK